MLFVKIVQTTHDSLAKRWFTESVPLRGTEYVFLKSCCWTQCRGGVYPHPPSAEKNGIHTTCQCLSEALIENMLSYIPRLRSLRSLSLGLLRASLTEAVSLCCPWRMGINPTPTLAKAACFAMICECSLGLSRVNRGCEVSIQRVVSDGCRVRPSWPSVII